MEKKRSGDAVMVKTLLHLVRDFNASVGLGAFNRLHDVMCNKGIKEFRKLDFPIWDNSDPYFLKAQLQLGLLFKRYRFKHDVFTDDELLSAAKEKFLATQQRIAEPFVNDEIVFRVLQRARSLAKGILGEYNLEEHYSLCRFGKRACFGHTFRESYLDSKLCGPLTGSTEHIAWFRQYLLSDPILSDVIEKCAPKGKPIYEVCDTLKLSFVPKSWKSLRTIKPNTLLGSFYTYGLGRVIQDRLLHAGLDINRLQEKHKRLAQRNSITRALATADLSAASDSITSEMLRKILPLPWFRAVVFGRTSHVIVDGVRQQLFSVATMGDGHTFPLQTLVFYCLLKAIGDLLGRRTYVSVYGDDLIYPAWLHKYVTVIFPKLHLQLNLEKTYAHTHYRESCGGDYHHGVDVRPFSIEGGNQLFTARQYTEFLYKLLNGLARRWDPVEIPETWNMLLEEVILSYGSIFQVPPSFPDGAGLKVASPLRGFPYEPVIYSKSSCAWVFSYLHTYSDHRVVKAQYPYYWDTLRNSESSCVKQTLYDLSDTETLIWTKATKAPIHVRSQCTGRRLRRLVACTPRKAAVNIKRQKGSSSAWC